MSKPLTKADFTNEREVRWCPGCGDYAILAALQKTLPKLGLPPEKHVFISGIGCSGRLPYYMNAYGFHTLHGRAPTVATGLKAMRDDLCVWLITGDGDGLSIGTNHLVHMLRRNIDINIILVNNQVYGLTKGQYSPTSPKGMVTKTSPDGVAVDALNPMMLALASGASFAARGVDKDPKHLGELIEASFHHQGTSFLEIYQDCHIFNPGAFDAFSTKSNREQHVNYLTDKPESLARAMALSQQAFPEHPVPLGVFYQDARESFKVDNNGHKKRADLEALLRAKASFKVEA